MNCAVIEHLVEPFKWGDNPRYHPEVKMLQRDLRIHPQTPKLYNSRDLTYQRPYLAPRIRCFQAMSRWISAGIIAIDRNQKTTRRSPRIPRDRLDKHNRGMEQMLIDKGAEETVTSHSRSSRGFACIMRSSRRFSTMWVLRFFVVSREIHAIDLNAARHRRLGTHNLEAQEEESRLCSPPVTVLSTLDRSIYLLPYNWPHDRATHLLPFSWPLTVRTAYYRITDPWPFNSGTN